MSLLTKRWHEDSVTLLSYLNFLQVLKDSKAELKVESTNIKEIEDDIVSVKIRRTLLGRSEERVAILTKEEDGIWRIEWFFSPEDVASIQEYRSLLEEAEN